MFNLIIILLSTINSEPKDSNNYKIAKYLIENMRDLEKCSITDLAEKCYVSNSSISRFCREIGLKDFSELKVQVARIPLLTQQTSTKYNFPNSNEDNIFQSYCQAVTNNLTLLSKNNINQEVNELVDEIYNYKHVAAFGYMHSENIALNLQYDLQTSGKMIFTRIKITDQINYIQNASDDTLIIVFSDTATYFDRLFPRTIPFKDTESKPNICMITSNAEQDLPYINSYIRYHSMGHYASHPYPLMIIADTICIEYARKYSTL